MLGWSAWSRWQEDPVWWGLARGRLGEGDEGGEAMALGERSRLGRLRGVEDAALAVWRRACAEYDLAIATRDRAVARARRRLERAVQPLSQRRCERLERALADQNLAVVAGYAPAVGNVRGYLGRVRQARADLVVVRAEQDAQADTARRARGAAAQRLLDLPPLPPWVVGASRQQLGTIAATCSIRSGRAGASAARVAAAPGIPPIGEEP